MQHRIKNEFYVPVLLEKYDQMKNDHKRKNQDGWIDCPIISILRIRLHQSGPHGQKNREINWPENNFQRLDFHHDPSGIISPAAVQYSNYREWRARRRAERKRPGRAGAPRVCAWGKPSPQGGSAFFRPAGEKNSAVQGALPPMITPADIDAQLHYEG
jgi:hypothetical protein